MNEIMLSSYAAWRHRNPQPPTELGIVCYSLSLGSTCIMDQLEPKYRPTGLRLRTARRREDEITMGHGKKKLSALD
ncbi:hypothetical protein BBP40_001815 [Aspergillus hancockii]|nr:hypothetical protein BBP40_001815 [Aspergillus hancockii]